MFISILTCLSTNYLIIKSNFFKKNYNLLLPLHKYLYNIIIIYNIHIYL